MKVLQVSHSDIPGEVFNGYNLMCGLLECGVECSMLVKNKRSNNTNVRSIIDKYDAVNVKILDALSNVKYMENIVSPWIECIINSDEWKQADIVHYHLLRAFPISVTDMGKLFFNKNVVLTMHDFWPITGGCHHKMECMKWKNGCNECARQDVPQLTGESNPFAPYQFIKKYECFTANRIDIVVSCQYTKNKVEECGWFCRDRIHTIPFGIYVDDSSSDMRRLYNINDGDIIIGFRNNNPYIKGTQYVYEALNELECKNIVLLVIGDEHIPNSITTKYRTIQFDWLGSDELNAFYKACDIYLMPSIAESFGLMAVEAMAYETAVITFKDTAVEENINAPGIGIAVKYKNSHEMACAIAELINDSNELKDRKQKGKVFVRNTYNKENYINNHIELYNAISRRI